MEGSHFFNPEHFPEDPATLEFDPSESTPERKKIKPELTVIVPEGFTLGRENLGSALEAVVHGHHRGDSVQELRASRFDYTDRKVYPVPIHIMAHEIVGTESPSGWAGLVDGIGTEDRHAKPQALTTVLQFAQRVLVMEQSEKNDLIAGIDLVAHGRDFFVDSDGRHRIFTLKALEHLGCYVAISGVKVAELVSAG